MNKRLAYSLLLLGSVAGADTTKSESKKVEPKRTDVLRWDGFSR